MTGGNLFDGTGTPAARGERVTVLHAGTAAKIERIVSRDWPSPPTGWYDQDADEWVAVLEGEGTLEIEGGSPLVMRPGHWVLLPAHTRHRVTATSTEPPCVWLAVHFPHLP